MFQRLFYTCSKVVLWNPQTCYRNITEMFRENYNGILIIFSQEQVRCMNTLGLEKNSYQLWMNTCCVLSLIWSDRKGNRFNSFRLMKRFVWECNKRALSTHFFFISNPIFRLSLELLSEVPKMRLKIAMKLLTFFGDYRLK